jgi:hypothetical protein
MPAPESWQFVISDEQTGDNYK